MRAIGLTLITYADSHTNLWCGWQKPISQGVIRHNNN